MSDKELLENLCKTVSGLTKTVEGLGEMINGTKAQAVDPQIVFAPKTINNVEVDCRMVVDRDSYGVIEITLVHPDPEKQDLARYLTPAQQRKLVEWMLWDWKADA